MRKPTLLDSFLRRCNAIKYGITFRDVAILFVSFLYNHFRYIYLHFTNPKLKSANELNNPIADVKIKVDNFVLFCRKGTADVLMCDAINETESAPIINNIGGKILVDCGAHIGRYTIPLAKNNPDAKVFAFEPNPETYKALLKNLEINGIKNVRAFNMALYFEKAKVDFYISKTVGGVRSLTKDNILNPVKIQVDAVRLDDFLKALGVDTADFIKIDVEGMNWMF